MKIINICSICSKCYFALYIKLQKLKNKDGIIVCKRSQGTYHYYKYQEFKAMIDRGELSFVVTGDSSADEILAELKQGKYDEEGGSNE